MTETKRVFVPITDLLPEEVLSKLSKHAKSLYGSLWNGMRWHGKSVFHWTDNQAARCARFELRFVPQARVELIDLGLFHVGVGTNAADGQTVWRYEFTADRN
jgi:hypothetical protein